MAIGVQLVDAGDALSSLLDLHVPRLEPAFAVWRCRYSGSRKFVADLGNCLDRMHERHDLERGHIRLIAAASASQAREIWCQCIATGQSRVAGATWTVIISPDAVEPPEHAADSLIVVVPSHPPGQQLVGKMHTQMMVDWVSFVLDIARQQAARDQWHAWFSAHARPSHRGQDVAIGTILGLASRESLRPASVQATLARSLAAHVSRAIEEKCGRHEEPSQEVMLHIRAVAGPEQESGEELDVAAYKLAERVAVDVFGQPGEEFDPDLAEENRAVAGTKLAQQLAVEARAHVTIAQKAQIRWRSDFRKAIDSHLRQGGWQALGGLARTFEQYGYGTFPANPRASATANGPVRTPQLGRLDAVVAALLAWQKSLTKTEPAALAISAWLVWFGTLLGLTLAGWVQAASAVAPGAPAPPLASTVDVDMGTTVLDWLAAHSIAFGLSIGLAVSVTVGLVVYSYQAHVARRISEQMHLDFLEAREDWTFETARDIAAALTILLELHSGRGRSFQRMALFETYRSLRCILAGVRRNTSLFGAGDQQGFVGLPLEFFRAALPLGRPDQIIDELDRQLALPTWRYHLDVMDDSTLTERCKGQFLEFAQRLPVETHVNLAPFLEQLVRDNAWAMRRRLLPLLDAAPAGEWSVGAPMEIDLRDPLAVSTQFVRTLESVYVTFCGDLPESGGGR